MRVFHSERASWSGNLELIFDMFEVPVLRRFINTCDNDLSERSQIRFNLTGSDSKALFSGVYIKKNYLIQDKNGIKYGALLQYCELFNFTSAHATEHFFGRVRKVGYHIFSLHCTYVLAKQLDFTTTKVLNYCDGIQL